MWSKLRSLDSQGGVKISESPTRVRAPMPAGRSLMLECRHGSGGRGLRSIRCARDHQRERQGLAALKQWRDATLLKGCDR
eukprot:scaffold503_cov375-Pinguiococcus_pyrenoidosus.AAC.1